jgi:uncharacterized protein involved in outer membrane biogenesis
MHRLKTSIIYTAALAAVVGVAGFFIAPPIAKSVLTKKLSEALHRPASIKKSGSTPSCFPQRSRRVQTEIAKAFLNGYASSRLMQMKPT